LPVSDQNPELKGILYACVTALFWGFLAIAVKVGLNYVPPITIVWFRFGVAFLLLFSYFLIFDRSSLKILYRPPWQLLVAAGGLAANYICFTLGIQHTTPNNAQIFIQTGPLMLAVAGIVVFREKLSVRQIAGYIVAGTGFYLFYSDQMEGRFALQQDHYFEGVLWTLLAALCWAIYAIFQKVIVKRYHPQQLNLFIFAVAAILYFPVADFSFIQIKEQWLWALLVFLGLNTLIAYGCLSAALKYAEANKISIIITVNPIITFIAMGIFTSLEVSWIAPENVQMKGIIGALLVLSGAALVIWKKKARIKR